VTRVALVLAGFWLGLLVASWVMASANLRLAERVIGEDMRPELATRLGTVSHDDRRVALRHLAAEINRWMFRQGSLAQVLLGFGLVGLVWPLAGAPRILSLTALVLTVVQAFGLAGEIASVGRGIEFLPRPLPAHLARRFGALHGAYVVADLLKMGALAVAAFLLARRP
jgi:hypothetical protein